MNTNNIEYHELPELPGKKFFRCSVHRATLTTEACAGMWNKSRSQEPPDSLLACKSCPVGAIHAGDTEANLSRLRDSDICPRCHRGGSRMIKDELCVSCYNRQREFVKGRNARGVPPARMPKLQRRSTRYFVSGKPHEASLELSVDQDEVIFTVLRSNQKRVTFAFRADANINQLRLF